MEAHARRVEIRRSSESRSSCAVREAAAWRAICFNRPAGTKERSSCETPIARISVSRPSALMSPGPLICVGARRSRSNGDCLLSSAVCNRSSSKKRCEAVGRRASSCQRRLAARSRTLATRRSRTLTPGRRIFWSTSRFVARSNNILGRSAVSQA